MLTSFWELGLAALVMLGWVALALVLAFAGYFLVDLIGERIYGRNSNRRN